MAFVKDLLFMLLRSFLYRKASQSLRKKSVLVYLRALQAVRRGLAGSVLVILFLQLMILGFVGCVVVGVFLIPQDLETRLWILLGIFGVLFLVPLLALLVFFSERVWYRHSGAEKMVSELQE